MPSMYSLAQEAQLGREGACLKPFPGRKEDRRRLAEAIDRLPETGRLVLGLRFYESIRPRQIAMVLGISEEDVRRILVDSVRQILRLLDPKHAADRSEERAASDPASMPTPQGADPAGAAQPLVRPAASSRSSARAPMPLRAAGDSGAPSSRRSR